MKPAKMLLVAKREYGVQIRHWSFWLVTFGFPLLLMLMGGVSLAVFLYFAGREMKAMARTDNAPKMIGLVDPAQLIDLAALAALEDTQRETKRDRTFRFILEEMNLPDSLRRPFEQADVMMRDMGKRYQYQAFTDRAAGEAALRERDIRALMVLDPEYRTNFHAELVYLNENKQHRLPMHEIERQITLTLLRAHFDAATIDHAMEPLNSMETRFLEQAPANSDESVPTDAAAPSDDSQDRQREKTMDLVLGAFFSMGMIMLVLISTNRLLMGMVEEKQNRVLEVLLSSMTAGDLMGGKVLGLGAVAFTQFLVWSMLGLLPMFMIFRGFDMSFLELFLFLLYFVLGYLLVATVILGLGSLVSNAQEAGQWTGYLIIMFIVPLYGIPFLLKNPDSWFGTFCTMFPFCSPVMAAFRLGSGTLGLGEALISLGILAATLYLALRFSAKLFRLGILMTGSAPSPLKVLRLLRDA